MFNIFSFPRLLHFTRQNRQFANKLHYFRNFSSSSTSSSPSFLHPITSFLKFRARRLYHSFYYAQYTNKYVLVLLFPATIFYVRFRNDTSLFYRVYLTSPPSSAAGDSTNYTKLIYDLEEENNTKSTGNQERKNGNHSNSHSREGEKNSNFNLKKNGVTKKDEEATSLLPIQPPRMKGGDLPLMGWTNGKKFFMSDDSTVKDLMVAVWGNAEKIPHGVVAACRGRVLDEDDNLSIAVKAFCRRDPKIFMWREVV